MLIWIVLGLVLYYVGVFLPSLFLIPRIGVVSYLASRDSDPEPTIMQGRAKRACANFQESLAPFLVLAVLAMIVPDVDMTKAIFGAQLFVLARLAYLPLYLLAVPVVRSVAWILGFAGLITMVHALI